MVIIVESEFSRASEMNSVLYDRVCENIVYQHKGRYKNSLGNRRTGFALHEQNIEEINELTSWIQHILPDVSKKFATKTGENKVLYNVNSFEIAECWGVHYNRGESLIEHCHFPYSISFVYYVKTPKGTAPIIIENETHEVKEGQCIFFLASQYHTVSPNDCDGRCAIVGNILYRF